MIKFLLCVSILTMYIQLFGQDDKPIKQSCENDKIILLDKTSVECKVVRVTESTIEIDPSGPIPFEIIDRSKVDAIIYSDNTVVKFDQQLSNNRNTLETIEWSCFSSPKSDVGAQEISIYVTGNKNDSRHVEDKKMIICNGLQLNVETHYDVRFERKRNASSFIKINSLVGRVTISDANEVTICSRNIGISEVDLHKTESFTYIIEKFLYKDLIFSVLLYISNWYSTGDSPKWTFHAITKLSLKAEPAKK